MTRTVKKLEKKKFAHGMADRDGYNFIDRHLKPRKSIIDTADKIGIAKGPCGQDCVHRCVLHQQFYFLRGR